MAISGENGKFVRVPIMSVPARRCFLLPSQLGGGTSFCARRRSMRCWARHPKYVRRAWESAIFRNFERGAIFWLAGVVGARAKRAIGWNGREARRLRGAAWGVVMV